MLAVVIFHLVHPYGQLSHAWSSWVYILPVAAFSILYNIPKFFELTTEVHTFTRYNNLTNISNLTEADDMQNNVSEVSL